VPQRAAKRGGYAKSAITTSFANQEHGPQTPNASSHLLEAAEWPEHDRLPSPAQGAASATRSTQALPHVFQWNSPEYSHDMSRICIARDARPVAYGIITFDTKGRWVTIDGSTRRLTPQTQSATQRLSLPVRIDAAACGHLSLDGDPANGRNVAAVLGTAGLSRGDDCFKARELAL
jgi:hypothetical protein